MTENATLPTRGRLKNPRAAYAMRNFGARLGRFRKMRGFTQRTLATAINRHEGTVSAWEQSRAEPYATDLARLVNVLRISMEQLFGVELFNFADETLIQAAFPEADHE